MDKEQLKYARSLDGNLRSFMRFGVSVDDTLSTLTAEDLRKLLRLAKLPVPRLKCDMLRILGDYYEETK